MTVAAHAILGAAIGTLARRRWYAFLAGIGTHLVADLVPHRDFDIVTEAALATAALTAIGVTIGFDSPAFAGALGGAAPDLENGLASLGVVRRAHFPSHTGVHGKPRREVTSQILLSCALLGFTVWNAGRKKRRSGDRPAALASD